MPLATDTATGTVSGTATGKIFKIRAHSIVVQSRDWPGRHFTARGLVALKVLDLVRKTDAEFKFRFIGNLVDGLIGKAAEEEGGNKMDWKYDDDDDDDDDDGGGDKMDHSW